MREDALTPGGVAQGTRKGPGSGQAPLQRGTA